MKKKRITKIAMVLLMTISSGLCYPTWLNAIVTEELQMPAAGKDTVNPVDVFDQAGTSNSNYPFFDQQGIDWKALYKVYRPKVSPQQAMMNSLRFYATCWNISTADILIWKQAVKGSAQM